jgi:DNA sulfur modification protein DndD
MWISRLTLRNFKSYQNQVFNFPPLAGGKNLVLIGGLNGYGKTTLLEAIYVGLYGEEAVSQRALDRAGLKAKGYGHFLETALYKHALRNGEDRMEVSIEITRLDKGCLRITRKWFFTHHGRYDNQRLVIETQAPGTTAWKLLPEAELPDLLAIYAVPAWLAPFFFFDGEKIAVLAEENRTDWIRSGLENLMGVVLVKELRDRLAAYCTAKLKQSGGVDEQVVDKLQEQLADALMRRKEIADALQAMQAEFQHNSEERDSLTRQLRDLAQGSDARTMAEVVETIAGLEQEEDRCRSQLRDKMSTALPLQLVSRTLQASLTEALDQEDTLANWENFRDAQQPRWQQFHQTFFKSQWIQGLCHIPTARESLEKTLTEAWESLYYPRPSGCADEQWHAYLQTNERRQLVEMRRRIQLSGGVLRPLASRLDELTALKWRLQQERIRLEGASGADRSAEVERISADLATTQGHMDELRGRVEQHSNQLRTLESELPQLTATYERERKKLTDGQPDRVAAQRAEQTIAMIDALLPALFQLKLKALSEAATRIFRSLHHKDQVARIVVQDDGKATLYSHEGTEITLPKSSGESQLFVLSLVGALAEVTGYKVPLIVDTPLARLSETHCNNLLDYWTQDGARQVILLAQDKEIGGAEFARLGRHVACSYLLQHEQTGHGVGKTQAIVDQYFVKAAA